MAITPIWRAGAATSPKFDLSTSYQLIWERRTLQPDASPWDEAAVDDLQIGVEVN